MMGKQLLEVSCSLINTIDSHAGLGPGLDPLLDVGEVVDTVDQGGHTRSMLLPVGVVPVKGFFLKNVMVS